MKAITLIVSALTLLLFTQCKIKNTGTGLEVTGKVGEILVVCEDDIWASDVKQSLDTNLTQFIMPYLPDVTTFELLHKTPKHFTQGVKRYRNTLFLNIDPAHKGSTGKVETIKDKWATGQLVVEITAKDKDQLLATCRTQLGKVHDQFDDIEWRRLIDHFKRSKTKQTQEDIKEQFGIDIVLPERSAIVTKRTNFYRVEFPPASRPIDFANTGGEDPGTIASGVMIYQYPYKGKDQFELKRLLQARDTMLKYNVPYEVHGMYMGTQYAKQIYPEGSYVYNADKSIKGYEMRGMFKFVGRPKHAPGGAFWAFHFVNKKTNKLVCVSGYVDAPITTSWTHPLREVQAVTRSVKIAE